MSLDRSGGPSAPAARRTRADGVVGPVPVRGGGTRERPWRDGEEGQSGGVHEGDAGAAPVRLQQRRGSDPADARGGRLRRVQRAGRL